MKQERSVLAVGLFFFLLVAIWAISPESLWTDEFGTWILTRADSLPEWWRQLQNWPDSDSQIPLYHFYMYEWTKVFGVDALAMRASNIGMFVVANCALLWPFRARPNLAVPVILTTCLNACTWYYLNEIRPYIMLYMGVCLMLGAAIAIAGGPQKPSLSSMGALCLGAVIATGATVIGIAWAGPVFLFLLVYWLRTKRRPLSQLIGDTYPILAVAALCIIALIAHDIRMFLLGKLPAPGDSSFLTLVFSFYANFGLLGLGPGMLDLRANGAGALIPFAPIIACSSVILGLVAVAGLLESKSMLGMRTVSLACVCALLPILFIVGLGVVVHWRALPRHFIPLASLFSILYAFGLGWWWRKETIGKAIAVTAVLIMAYSAFSVRYAPRHRKDDYKHAAELAATELAHGGQVWWVADPRGALYYGVPVDDGRDAAGATQAHYVSEKTLPFLLTRPAPGLVLLSKPDAWDPQGAVQKYLLNNKYRIVETLPAFTAWRR